jgi:nucleotidyltransferase AbiEii toxin of type IV toxin-antitoxin system
VTRLQKALIRLDTDLRALGLKWALVGGFAVMLRVEARSTRDLDIVLAVTGDREVDDAVRGLRMRGYKDHPTKPMLFRKDGRLFGVRLVSPPLDADDDTMAIVDVLTGCSGVEREVVAAAEIREAMPKVFIPVARAGHLVALKVLAARPQDLEDVQVLLRGMGDADLKLARESLVLIERRGFLEDSTRSLQAELGRLLDQLDEQDF